jgi:ABC-type multidrug transport system ATPase subunit
VTAGTLSGGNQQKAVVAREFSRDLTALVLDQPTRGLDVGSIEFIHRQVILKRDAGAAILLVSAELDEVMELSDRIAVMFRGEIVALVDGPTAEREEIGLLMATGRRDAEALVAATTSMAAAAEIEAAPVAAVAASVDADENEVAGAVGATDAPAAGPDGEAGPAPEATSGGDATPSPAGDAPGPAEATERRDDE